MTALKLFMVLAKASHFQEDKDKVWKSVMQFLRKHVPTQHEAAVVIWASWLKYKTQHLIRQ